MHRKNNLDARLDGCAEILTVCDLSDKNMKRAAEVKDYFDFKKIFGNTNPVCLEIGCGKGKFVCETAAMNSELNFVACEKISNVIVDACERALHDGLKNVRFLNCAAEVLEKYFPPKSVDAIFQTPFPKKAIRNSGLPTRDFLKFTAGF